MITKNIKELHEELLNKKITSKETYALTNMNDIEEFLKVI